MKKFIRHILFIILIILIIICSSIFASGYLLYKDAITKVSIKDKITQIKEKEDFVSINDVPPNFKNAVIAVEDHRFEKHGVIDPIGISRAIFSNLQAKELKEGGSTITQQLAKNLYFASEKHVISRKIAEILIGYDLEKNYSKNEIFELYMNTIYFGDGYYGISQASKGYLNKQPKDMNLYECTMLAGIPNAPSVYSPSVNPKLTKKRQEKVINSMVEYGYLSKEDSDNLLNTLNTE